MALSSVLAEPPLYLPPGQGQDHFHNQYLPPGSHHAGPGGHGSPQFGHREIPLTRLSDANPSTQYGNIIPQSSRHSGNRNSPSNQYIPPTNAPAQGTGFQPGSSASQGRIGGGSAVNHGSGLHASPVTPGVLYSNPIAFPSEHGGVKPGLSHASGGNLGSGHHEALRSRLNSARIDASNQYGAPSSANAYSTLGIHNTSPPTSRGSSYAVPPSGRSGHFGNINPTQYSIPLPTLGPIPKGYNAPESVPPAQTDSHGGAQRGSSRHGPPAGFGSGRTPSPLYDVPASIYGVSRHTFKDDMSVSMNFSFHTSNNVTKLHSNIKLKFKDYRK